MNAATIVFGTIWWLARTANITASMSPSKWRIIKTALGMFVANSPSTMVHLFGVVKLRLLIY